ncbi:MAG: CHC2 zinc finger domain-containing protein, partial [Bacilli bacterium]
MSEHVNDGESHDIGIKRYIMYMLAKKINLIEFIEGETGHDFHKIGRQYRCACPIHGEKEPSFFVWQGSDDTWGFKCYGCQRKGTIIDFCIHYFELNSPIDALKVLAEKMQLGEDISIAKMLEAMSVKIDIEERIDCAHYVAATNCRVLLKKYFHSKEVREWIKSSYEQMSSHLEN